MGKAWFFLFFIWHAHAQDRGVVGTVTATAACSPRAMVWISLDKDHYNERLLLMHTLVPAGGKFQFYLNPGRYQLRASDEKGCEFFQRVEVKRGILTVDVKMEGK